MKRSRRINVSLTDELNALVRSQLRQRAYGTEEDVIRDALLILREQEEYIQSQQRQLRREIAVGLKQARQGLVGPFSSAEVKREGRKRLKSRRKAG